MKFPCAADGFQFPVVIVKVTDAVPLFFTYMGSVGATPGFSIPQLMVVTGIVQPLSENTLTPTEFTPVVLWKVLTEVSAAYVARNVPITATRAIVPIAILFIAIVFHETE